MAVPPAIIETDAIKLIAMSGNGEANFSWTLKPIIPSVKNLFIYYSVGSDTSGYTYVAFDGSKNPGLTSFTQQNLTNGVAYYYSIGYTDSNDNFVPIEIEFSLLPQNSQAPVSITSPPVPTVGYTFTLGFDEIDMGIANYQPASIYVSNKLNINSSNLIGLKTTESRPYADFTSDPTNYLYTTQTYDNPRDPTSTIGFVGSIEYYIVKNDLDIAGNLLRRSRFPILPIGVSRINNESLSPVSGLAGLQFFTTTSGNIDVYQNNNLISPTYWSVVSTTVQQTPNNGNPMQASLNITAGVNGVPLQSNDILTVSYDVKVSDTIVIPPSTGSYLPYGSSGVPNLVDLVGDLSARQTVDNLIAIDPVGLSSGAITSDIYLVIILRSNVNTNTVSPNLSQYTLFVNNPEV